MSEPIFQAKGISKSFPGVRALRDVSLDLFGGEILALLGENGAGKSTFIKIAAGVYAPDGGSLTIFGKEEKFADPRSALAAGIGVVHQELNSFPDLTIAENIMLNRYPMTKARTVDWKRMHEAAAAALARLDVVLDTDKRMKDCQVAEKQQIEIARVLFWNARIIILDEPTSSLNEVETRNLFAYLKKLREAGIAIVYISHKLDEIFELADRVTVLRDGAVVGTVKTAGTSGDDLIRMMVGREISDMYPPRASRAEDTVLQVRGLCSDALTDIGFDVRRGEIFGIYGLMGSGHIDIGKALFGYSKIKSGAISVGGKEIRVKDSHDAVLNGLAYVPSERKTEGLVLPQSLAANVMIAHYEKGKGMFISGAEERRTALKWIDALKIKANGPETAVGTLSGGNQQKVVLAKWLEVAPAILILNEPTRGIDVGAKVGIYAILNELCAQGLAIIMITSEMPELIAMSDRVLVVHEGRSGGFFEKGEINEVNIMAGAIGANNG